MRKFEFQVSCIQVLAWEAIKTIKHLLNFKVFIFNYFICYVKLVLCTLHTLATRFLTDHSNALNKLYLFDIILDFYFTIIHRMCKMSSHLKWVISSVCRNWLVLSFRRRFHSGKTSFLFIFQFESDDSRSAN